MVWEVRHFGVRQRLTVRGHCIRPSKHLQDVMISGAFKNEFSEHLEGTLMSDRFEFKSPFGVLGAIVDRVFLTSYMRRFIVRRNEVSKWLGESTEWSRYV